MKDGNAPAQMPRGSALAVKVEQTSKGGTGYHSPHAQSIKFMLPKGI